MNYQEKVRYLLRKKPSIKFNRGDFFWEVLREYYEAYHYATRPQLSRFFKEFASWERSLRDVLKEKEFVLPKEADNKRYEKSNQFRQAYAKRQTTEKDAT